MNKQSEPLEVSEQNKRVRLGWMVLTAGFAVLFLVTLFLFFLWGNEGDIIIKLLIFASVLLMGLVNIIPLKPALRKILTVLFGAIIILLNVLTIVSFVRRHI